MSNEQTKVLCDGKHIRLVARGKWEFAERKKVSGIVGIVAVTDENKLILVEQFRVPVNKRVIELPAGLAGDIAGSEDEALEIAAQRELSEETGYEAKTMTRLIDGAVSAGITSEIVTLFRAKRLSRTGNGGGDGSEDITVHEIPVDQVHAWVLSREKDGAIVDFKVYAGLFFVNCSPGQG
jgi:ADP-ribose pyrophosphatase